jgi:hypothetical protein
MAQRALTYACDRLSPSWDYTWHAAYLSYARANAARLEGRPALDEWGEGVQRAAGIGPYAALQPRLELAAEHLRVGDRATGKEQLVSVWDDARAMGAGWYERQAAVLATRTRVPLRGEDEAAGPLHRLTPREREVLSLLANGDRQGHRRHPGDQPTDGEHPCRQHPGEAAGVQPRRGCRAGARPRPRRARRLNRPERI